MRKKTNDRDEKIKWKWRKKEKSNEKCIWHLRKGRKQIFLDIFLQVYSAELNIQSVWSISGPLHLFSRRYKTYKKENWFFYQDRYIIIY